ncbi:hypothetical protein EYC84_002041 [Monilinia fructicola]|uniref:Uncharacterized protein n=1 Tax=Monilinia fructicola TaxID=38448 RepID=A0A5M9JUJ2_MONFR|nr:hypothetical protein EYC84_002041 [Monilinia fructicola]
MSSNDFTNRGMIGYTYSSINPHSSSFHHLHRNHHSIESTRSISNSFTNNFIQVQLQSIHFDKPIQSQSCQQLIFPSSKCYSHFMLVWMLWTSSVLSKSSPVLSMIKTVLLCLFVCLFFHSHLCYLFNCLLSSSQFRIQSIRLQVCRCRGIYSLQPRSSLPCSLQLQRCICQPLRL